MAQGKLIQFRSALRFEGASRRDYWRRFSALLALSVIIATMGLTRDSGAVVIAAMLIAPLMTPILGIAAAMMLGWTQRALRLFFIVFIAALASIALAMLVMFVADIPLGFTLPREVTARTDPGIEELIVALAAGAAGAYVQLNRKEISLLPGAAIGVALVPPLSAAGILLYFGEYRGGYEAYAAVLHEPRRHRACSLRRLCLRRHRYRAYTQPRTAQTVFGQPCGHLGGAPWDRDPVFFRNVGPVHRDPA
ncbi:MAG: DUF389 domain-containing protein [Rhodobacteraceae bacterium]|nr:DUF389 domain-containing protein [Paracoccaceae bacterium]